jgi:hypothetical protein
VGGDRKNVHKTITFHFLQTSSLKLHAFIYITLSG